MWEFAIMNSPNGSQLSQQQDRRQFKRFAMAFVAQARRDDLAALAATPVPPRPEQSLTLELRDFSLGGVGATSPMPLRPDEKLTIFMPPFGTRPRTELTGRVARCQRRGESFEVGIEFCQTRDAPESSPWLRIPELFYMSGGQDRPIV